MVESLWRALITNSMRLPSLVSLYEKLCLVINCVWASPCVGCVSRGGHPVGVVAGGGDPAGGEGGGGDPS